VSICHDRRADVRRDPTTATAPDPKVIPTT
jgi:hypothetical protein